MIPLRGGERGEGADVCEPEPALHSASLSILISEHSIPYQLYPTQETVTLALV